MKRWVILVLAFFSAAVSAKQEVPVLAPQNDPALQVRLEHRFGAAIPLDDIWHDERGVKVTLGKILGNKPTLLVLAYYHCPTLCPRVLQNLAATIGNDDFSDLRVIAASIDPRDDAKMAAYARDQFVQRANAPRSMANFLTGPEQSGRRLAEAVGIHYAYDAAHGEYVLPDTLVLVDGNGHVARYLAAFTTTTQDIRLALTDVEAVNTTNIWDHVLLLWYVYDPKTGHYIVTFSSMLRIAGIITVLIVLPSFWRLERKGRR